MAVDRWFGGIPLGNNAWYGSTKIAPLDKDTYFFEFDFQTDSSVKLCEIKLYGTPHKDGIKQVIAQNPAVGSIVEFGHSHFHHLKQESIVYVTGKAEAINTWIIGHGSGCNIKEVSGVRTLERVLSELTDENIGHFDLQMYAPDTNLWILEHQIAPASKPIVQPIHQATPAVADQLNIVSEDADDTVAGAGMQKAKVTYYDASLVEKTTADISMNGTTPVDLIALGYDDVYIVKKVFGTQWGASGINEGNIYLQDNV